MTTTKEVIPVKHQTAKHVISYSMAVGVTQILMMAYTVVLMHWVTPEQFGIISANYATILLLSFLINWGMNEWLVKTIPTSDKPDSLTGSVIRFKVIVGIVWGILIWAFLPFIQPEIYQRGVLFIIILDVWMDSCVNMLLAGLLGKEKVGLTSLLLILTRVIRLGGLLLLILLGKKSLELVLIARLLSTLSFLILIWVLAHPLFKRDEIIGLKQVFKYSLAFNASELFSLLLSQADVIFLTWFVGDAILIGSYAIVTTITNMVMTIPLGIYNLLIPQSIKAHQMTPRDFKKQITESLLVFGLLAIIVWGAIAIPGTKWIINILGEEYSLSAQFLALAAPILFVRILNQTNNVYLVSVGQEKQRILPQAIAVSIKIVIGILVVIKWQVVGLIILGIVVEAFLLLMFTYRSYRHYRIRTGLQET